jgi:hypothetical protein
MRFITFISLVVFLASTNIKAADEFRFYCYGTKADFNGFLDLTTHVEAFMTVKGSKAILHGHDFSYKLNDGNAIWSSANVESEHEVANNPNYRPFVHKDHFQFDISPGVMGRVKLLVPFNAGKTDDDHFFAVLIFTHIDDHAGDSVMVECSID